jgi:hypothetical protein
VSTPHFIAICILGFIGFCSVLVLLILVASSTVQREIDEFEFRKNLRRAIERDASRPGKPARHVARAHSRSHVEPALTRRPRV